MTQAVLSVLLKTKTASGKPDPNFRSLIPLSSVQQVRQNASGGVTLVQLDGKEVQLQGAWMDYFHALEANVIKVAPGP